MLPPSAQDTTATLGIHTVDVERRRRIAHAVLCDYTLPLVVSAERTSRFEPARMGSSLDLRLQRHAHTGPKLLQRVSYLPKRNKRHVDGVGNLDRRICVAKLVLCKPQVRGTRVSEPSGEVNTEGTVRDDHNHRSEEIAGAFEGV